MTFPRTELRPGYSASRIIKGHWQVADGHLREGALDARDDLLADMKAFVDAGITTFDVADIYTGAEELIGDFIRKYKTPVQVHTKYVPDLNLLPTVDLAGTASIIERSLKRLNVERLDLVQFHWWDYSVPRYAEVATYLKELQQQGKIRYIGVTNFDLPRLTEILDAGVDIVSAQVQYSVLDRRPEKGFSVACKLKNITMLCYGSLAGGYLSDKYLDAPDDGRDVQALENRSLTKYRLIIEEIGGWENYQKILRCLHGIGEKHGLGIGEIAIAYTLTRENVGACIVGAHNGRHLARMKKLDGFILPENDALEIADLISGFPIGPGDMYEVERTAESHRGIMKYNLNKAAG
jgi:aryl-alcohol dehydrogenase-like predicted oxidoreductase